MYKGRLHRAEILGEKKWAKDLVSCIGEVTAEMRGQRGGCERPGSNSLASSSLVRGYSETRRVNHIF
jgi:hypothetical protein